MTYIVIKTIGPRFLASSSRLLCITFHYSFIHWYFLSPLPLSLPLSFCLQFVYILPLPLIFSHWLEAILVKPYVNIERSTSLLTIRPHILYVSIHSITRIVRAPNIFRLHHFEAKFRNRNYSDARKKLNNRPITCTLTKHF